MKQHLKEGVAPPKQTLQMQTQDTVTAEELKPVPGFWKAYSPIVLTILQCFFYSATFAFLLRLYQASRLT